VVPNKRGFEALRDATFKMELNFPQPKVTTPTAPEGAVIQDWDSKGFGMLIEMKLYIYIQYLSISIYIFFVVFFHIAVRVGKCWEIHVFVSRYFSMSEAAEVAKPERRM